MRLDFAFGFCFGDGKGRGCSDDKPIHFLK